MSIAERVGAPRIVRTRGIPYPTGDPSLGPDAERAWRRRLVERALDAVRTDVRQPTVFDALPGGTGPETPPAAAAPATPSAAPAGPATPSAAPAGAGEEVTRA